jgi:hypothetical protein
MKLIPPFVARDRADAYRLLLSKALPLTLKAKIRDRLDSLPDERMLITIGADHSITIQSHPAVIAPQPEVIQPEQPAKPRRSKK